MPSYTAPYQVFSGVTFGLMLLGIIIGILVGGLLGLGGGPPLAPLWSLIRNCPDLSLGIEVYDGKFR